MKTIYLLSTIISLLIIGKVNAQGFDEQMLKTTVLIEKIENNKFINHGTGFIMYNYNNPSELIVVSCAHLFINKKVISVRVTPDPSFIQYLEKQNIKGVVIDNVFVVDNFVRFVVILDTNNFRKHPTLDIAAFKFSIPVISHEVDSIETYINFTQLAGIPKSMIKYRNEIKLGGESCFIGFPYGLGSTELVEPVVRLGSVAWLPKNLDFYLLDDFSYGGNSGSPIFQNSKLIGMVIGHQGITIKNILNQPDTSKLRFEVNDIDLNLGLAKCLYVDDIMKVVNEISN